MIDEHMRSPLKKSHVDSPHEPPSARVDLMSAVMAGNNPIVMVKVKQTDTANSQI